MLQPTPLKPLHQLISEGPEVQKGPKRQKIYWELPANSDVRAKAAKIMALRISGVSDEQIAKEVGIQPRTLRQYLWLAAKNGWLRFDDPADRLEYELAPKIVDNIAHHLNLKDKVMTIEAAKGIGLFKTHQSLKNEGVIQQTVLALKIEFPTDAPRLVPPGAILGVARTETEPDPK